MWLIDFGLFIIIYYSRLVFFTMMTMAMIPSAAIRGTECSVRKTPVEITVVSMTLFSCSSRYFCLLCWGGHALRVSVGHIPMVTGAKKEVVGWYHAATRGTRFPFWCYCAAFSCHILTGTLLKLFWNDTGLRLFKKGRKTMTVSLLEWFSDYCGNS